MIPVYKFYLDPQNNWRTDWTQKSNRKFDSDANGIFNDDIDSAFILKR